MVRRPNYSTAQDSMQPQNGQDARGLADEYYNPSGQTSQPTPSHQVGDYTAASAQSAHQYGELDSSASPNYYNDAAYAMPPAIAAESTSFSGWGDAAYNPAPVDYTHSVQPLMNEPHTGAIKTEDLPGHYPHSDNNTMSPPAYAPLQDTSSYTSADSWAGSTQPDPYRSQLDSNQPLDQDRGLTGALAGGLAGGYAGHKVHHGFLGTVGGAYAGHKLQEAYKDSNKHGSSQHASTVAAAGTAAAAFSNPSTQQSGLAPSHDGPGLTSRSFLHSCGNIRLSSDGHTLKASARRVNGSTNSDAVIDLDKVLTNKDGKFEWVREAGNFSGSAKRARLEVVEGKGVWLMAELRDCRGKWREDRVFLADVVENCDGRLGWIE